MNESNLIEEGKYVFLKKYWASSPGRGAAIITGAFSNGWTLWKDKDSKSIGKLKKVLNAHLNLFHFFRDSGNPYYEDNLSRAFALCLKNDGLFLDKILQHLFPAQYYIDHFGYDRPGEGIKVDLQKRPRDLGSFDTIIAVAASGKSITEEEYKGDFSQWE